MSNQNCCRRLHFKEKFEKHCCIVIVAIIVCSVHCVLQDSGAHIKVFVQCCPHSTERVIQVAGQKDKVVVCIGIIMEDLIEVCLLLASYCLHQHGLR